MTKVFVIRNQHGHYLGKQQDWLDGSDRRQLYRTGHWDEAVNVVFEQSSRDISLRAEPLQCDVDKHGQPLVDAGPVTALEQSATARESDGELEVESAGTDSGDLA